MLGTLWTVYLIGYAIFTLPFAGFSMVYIIGFFLPGILFATWKIFEAMQSGGEFSVYTKVMGRFYFQCWAMILLPCAVLMNYGSEWIWIVAATMLILPTIIWYFMRYFVEIGTMLTDYESYDSCKRAGRDVWSTTNDLNWEEKQ